MPTGTGDEKPYLYTETEDIKLVSDYSRFNLAECLELDCYTYRLLFKDAIIHEYKKTEDGQEYLEDCWLLTQTEPDRQKLRKRFGD